MQVSCDNGTYSSTLGKSFSEEINRILMKSHGIEYNLYTDGNNLYAFDGKSVSEIYQVFNDGEDKHIRMLPSMMYQTGEKGRLTLENLLEPYYKGTVSPIQSAKGLIDYKTVPVSGVSQGNHPWCWAATCAALTNYYQGEMLSARDVATYVFPSNPEQGGTWTEVKKAYNHWGLYPTQTGVISFSGVKSNILNDSPMHLGLSGHSVGLIGYEDWGTSGDSILVLLEPNGGVRKTVTLKSNGNFNYYLSGTDSWIYTREF